MFIEKADEKLINEKVNDFIFQVSKELAFKHLVYGVTVCIRKEDNEWKLFEVYGGSYPQKYIEFQLSKDYQNRLELIKYIFSIIHDDYLKCLSEREFEINMERTNESYSEVLNIKECPKNFENKNYCVVWRVYASYKSK